MTRLARPIRRECENTRSHTGRNLIIEIRPGSIEVVFIREAGRRKGFPVPIAKIWQLANRIEADHAMAEKKAKRREKSKARKENGK
jgi:hypothetical protein